MADRYIMLNPPDGGHVVLVEGHDGKPLSSAYERVRGSDAVRTLLDVLDDPEERDSLLTFLADVVGSIDGKTLRQELHWFEQSGRLSVWRRPQMAPANLTYEPGEAPPLLSDLVDPEQEEVQTWFEVRLVDELGDPIAGIDLRWSYGSHTEVIATDGDGRSRLDIEQSSSFASVRIASQAALIDEVRPRWDQPSRQADKPAVEASDERTVVFLRDGVDTRGFNLAKETPHEVSIQPYVMLARLFGLTFETSKCFLLPEAIPSLRSMCRMYEGNPDSKLLLVGHTDTTGSPSYNDPLSLERAEAMGAFLTDDVDGWLQWYESSKPADKRWGSREDELMIAAFIGEAAQPGRSPTESFQIAFNEAVAAGELEGDTLEEDGLIGPKTRRALVISYMGQDSTTLPDDVELTLHGCGENFPLDEEGDDVDDDAADGTEDATDRRVELFFFEGELGVQPPTSGDNSAAGSKEYPEWRARARKVEDYKAGVQVPIFDWDNDLDDGMPKGATLTLKDAEHEMTIPWSDGARSGDRRRFVFGDLTGEEPCTLILELDGKQHVLLSDQKITHTEEPLKWEQWLEDFVFNPDELEEPSVGAAMPENHPGPFERDRPSGPDGGIGLHQL